MLMCASARLFQCARCSAQTFICRLCDRGNRYCSAACSEQARRASHNRANRKYARTRKGRHNNAERQRRYRQRQRKKVTDQGSPPKAALVSFPLLVNTPVLSAFLPVVAQSLSRICHFCFVRISDFVRNDFLHRSTRHRRG
jgi:hypothetical protein